MLKYGHFDVHHQKDVLVIQLVDPRLFDAMVVNELQEDLLAVIDKEKPRKVLISFEGVSHCSTAVINGLLRAKKRLMASGGQIKLCQMHPTIREAYKLLNLDGTVFHIHDTEAEALTAFGYLAK
jgi:anti-anti-sigma factor